MTGAEAWDRYKSDINETIRKWGYLVRLEALSSHVDTLKGRDRTKFWRQGNYSLSERSVYILFYWMERGTSLRNRKIELTLRKQSTPWENLEVLAKALEAVRLGESRKAGPAMSWFYRQMYPADQPEQPKQEDIPEHCRVLHILPGAPREVAEAAYRALAKQYHTDVGGSHEEMKKLNAAIERIRG